MVGEQAQLGETHEVVGDKEADAEQILHDAHEMFEHL
jgi:hypothetical protein